MDWVDIDRGRSARAILQAQRVVRAAASATRTLLGALAASVMLLAAPGTAVAICGDDVDGRRVACRCGDVVISDTRLSSDDPVVRDRCEGSGLYVRALDGARSIRLDLAGHSITGIGLGTGVYVIDGGSEGAVIVGTAATGNSEVAGFGTGFRARGQRSVKELRDIVFKANVRDGVSLRGAGTVLTGLRAERNGRDGIRLGGHGPRLTGARATGNGRYGIYVSGNGAHIDAQAADNVEAPARMVGRAHSGAAREAAP